MFIITQKGEDGEAYLACLFNILKYKSAMV